MMAQWMEPWVLTLLAHYLQKVESKEGGGSLTRMLLQVLVLIVNRGLGCLQRKEAIRGSELNLESLSRVQKQHYSILLTIASLFIQIQEIKSRLSILANLGTRPKAFLSFRILACIQLKPCLVIAIFNLNPLGH